MEYCSLIWLLLYMIKACKIRYLLSICLVFCLFRFFMCCQKCTNIDSESYVYDINLVLWWLLLFSHQVTSNSFLPYGLQHTGLFHPPLSPRVCSNSCLLNRWCYLTISSFATPFSFCLQPFPASGYFPVHQHFASGDQTIGVSASVLPMNTQDWSPLGMTGWISLQSKGLSRVFSNTTVQKHQFYTTR